MFDIIGILKSLNIILERIEVAAEHLMVNVVPVCTRNVSPQLSE